MPGDSYRQAVHLATAQGEHAVVRVSQAAVLHAKRESGPWVAADRDSLTADSCWLTSPPPPLEPEVADNVTWHVEPPGSAIFDV